jgi:hypothetical protein
MKRDDSSFSAVAVVVVVVAAHIDLINISTVRIYSILKFTEEK